LLEPISKLFQTWRPTFPAVEKKALFSDYSFPFEDFAQMTDDHFQKALTIWTAISPAASYHHCGYEFSS
jgi:hypothetical protein